MSEAEQSVSSNPNYHQAQKSAFQQMKSEVRLLSLTDENKELLKKFHAYLEILTASYTTSDGMITKRFGLLGRMAELIPVHLFDNEALKKVFPTAVTDGSVILFNVDLFKKMLETEKEYVANKNQKHLEVMPVLMHEVLHCMFEHTKRSILNAPMVNDRMSYYTLAMEYSVNVNVQNLLKDFNYEPGPELKKLTAGELSLEEKQMGIEQFTMGLSEQDLEKYLGKSEYEIMNDLYAQAQRNQERMNKNPNKKKNPQGQPGSGGQGSSAGGSGSGSQPQNSQGSSGSTPQNGNGQGSQQQGSGTQNSNNQNGGNPMKGPPGMNGMPDDAVLSPTEMRDTLEKAGLGEIADKLKLPKDAEEEAKYNRESMNRVINEVARQAAEDARNSDCRAAGKFLTEAMSQRIKALGNPSIRWGEEWLEALDEEIHMMVSRVGKLSPLPDIQEDWNAVQDDAHFMESIGLQAGRDIIFTNPFVNFQHDTASLVLVDTSGSVSNHMLARFLTEIKGFAEECASYNHPVYIMSADTVLRGEMEPIDPYDLDAYNFLGRGGTMIKECIEDATKMMREEQKKIINIIYFTDGEDSCNFSAESVCPDARLAFVIPPDGNHRFKVKGASTICIDPSNGAMVEAEAPDMPMGM